MKHSSLFLIVILLFVCSQNNNEQAKTQKDNSENIYDEWRLKTEDKVSLFIREFGTGDTVLILHGGWGAEHSYLIEAFQNFSDKYHFVFYDQRGSLRSQCSDSLISVEAHIEDVERIRKSLGIEKAVIIGHSMGGFLGMSYLAKYPENVKGLILIASAPAVGSVKNLTNDIVDDALARWKRKEVIDTLKAYELDSEIKPEYTDLQRGLWHRITFAALNLHDVKNWRSVKGAFYHNGSSAAIAAETGPQEWDFTAVLNQSNFPIYLIHGDDDYLPLEFHEKWLKKVHNAKLNVIKNAGHLSWIDNPQQFNNYIQNALTTCYSR